MDNITTSKQKERALDILTRSFHQSPGMTWFFRKRANRLKALRAFVNYCLVQASVYQGAFITSDRNGLAFLLFAPGFASSEYWEAVFPPD